MFDGEPAMRVCLRAVVKLALILCLSDPTNAQDLLPPQCPDSDFELAVLNSNEHLWTGLSSELPSTVGGDIGGAFRDATNWYPDVGVPDAEVISVGAANDVAIFGGHTCLSGTGTTVYFDDLGPNPVHAELIDGGSGYSRTLHIQSGNYRFDLGGHAYNIRDGIFVGEPTRVDRALIPATLAINNGTVALYSKEGKAFQVGNMVDGVLRVEADGRLDATQLTIGGTSRGTLDVQTDGVVNVAGLQVGGTQPAVVNVQEGAVLNATDGYIVGFGLVSISGVGAKATGKNVAVGVAVSGAEQPTALLEVSDGANLTLVSEGGNDSSDLSGLDVGMFQTGNSRSEVRVAGEGSAVVSDSPLRVSALGINKVTIEDGGFVRSTKGRSAYGSSGIIGLNLVDSLVPSSNSSTVMIRGPGSRWEQDDSLAVGWNARGRLTIGDGGKVASAEGVVAKLAGSQGDVSVSGMGASWTIDNSLFVGGDAATPGGQGKVTVQNLAEVRVENRLHLWEGSAIDVANRGSVYIGSGSPPAIPNVIVVGPQGGLTGTGTIFGDVIVTEGITTPGSPAGVLTIEGGFHQTRDGSLTFEIDGAEQSQRGLLHVGGDANLHGTVQLTFVDGFAPRAGDSFELISARGGLDDANVRVEFINLTTGFEFEIGTNGGVFRVTALTDGVFVPEPNAYLMALGATPLRRRRQRGRIQYSNSLTC